MRNHIARDDLSGIIPSGWVELHDNLDETKVNPPQGPTEAPMCHIVAFPRIECDVTVDSIGTLDGLAYYLLLCPKLRVPVEDVFIPLSSCQLDGTTSNVPAAERYFITHDSRTDAAEVDFLAPGRDQPGPIQHLAVGEGGEVKALRRGLGRTRG